MRFLLAKRALMVSMPARMMSIHYNKEKDKSTKDQAFAKVREWMILIEQDLL